jgi:hypothetical protein
VIRQRRQYQSSYTFALNLAVYSNKR